MQQKFLGTRIVKKHQWHFGHDAQTIFLLLCPTRELDWIEEWDALHTLIYSESGIAEDACVFTSDIPGEGEAVWIAGKYSLEERHVTYIKFLKDNDTVIRWEMTAIPEGAHGCHVDIAYTITGLSLKGNRFAAEFGQNGFPYLVTQIEKLINHYLTTGRKLKFFA